MMNASTFYLSSSEYETWRDVRECAIVGHLLGPRNRGYWRVRVSPAVPGSILGGGQDATELVLAERYREDDLRNLQRGPITVYVCRIVNPTAVQNGRIEEADIDLVAWAEVANSQEDLPTYQHPVDSQHEGDES